MSKSIGQRISSQGCVWPITHAGTKMTLRDGHLIMNLGTCCHCQPLPSRTILSEELLTSHYGPMTITGMANNYCPCAIQLLHECGVLFVNRHLRPTREIISKRTG